MNTSAGFGSKQKLDVIRKKVVELSKELSLTCTMEDVLELLHKESLELKNEELIELEEERVAEEEKRKKRRKKRRRYHKGSLPIKESPEGLSLLNQLLVHFEVMNLNTEPFTRIEQLAHGTFRQHREFYIFVFFYVLNFVLLYALKINKLSSFSIIQSQNSFSLHSFGSETRTSVYTLHPV